MWTIVDGPREYVPTIGDSERGWRYLVECDGDRRRIFVEAPSVVPDYGRSAVEEVLDAPEPPLRIVIGPDELHPAWIFRAAA
jgi:hypothetical protein